jgi:phytoene dehydrogenase-like protein
MPEPRDVVILGAGHNGLVTAFYLAKAGYKPLILERRPTVGGCAITEEFHPGFRCSRLAHSAGPMRSDIVRGMELEKHGLKTYTPDVRVLSLSGDGKPLVLYSDAGKSQQEIARFSQKDATNYVEFQKPLARIGEVANLLMTMTPPDLGDPAANNLWELVKAGRKVRGLGEKDLYRMMRWGPMAVADLVAEWFDTELLRGTIAAQGIFGTFLGPWSAGSTATLLLRCASDGNPAVPASYIVGGIGALTAAMAAAATEAGAEIRTSCEVTSIKVKDDSATGVVLANGDEIDARTVVSNADPKRTLLRLVDPQYLEPSFLQKLQHYRMNGTVAKVNLALGGLPKFKGANGDAALLSGRIQVSPDIDYLERAVDAAKYGEFSQHPYLEATIPTLWDESLAPAGKHNMRRSICATPTGTRNAMLWATWW